MPIADTPFTTPGGNTYTPSTYGATVAGGGSRANAALAAPAYPKGKTPAAGVSGDPSLSPTIDFYTKQLGTAMTGYADMAGQDFQKQIGQMLGNLNSIGALRSGGVQAGINQAMQMYGRQIGDTSKTLATEAATMGSEENNAVLERQFRQQQLDASRHNSLLGSIGGLVGGVAGSFLGPVGTALGTAVGKKIAGG